jgi:hypothetical protein
MDSKDYDKEEALATAIHYAFSNPQPKKRDKSYGCLSGAPIPIPILMLSLIHGLASAVPVIQLHKQPYMSMHVR